MRPRLAIVALALLLGAGPALAQTATHAAKPVASPDASSQRIIDAVVRQVAGNPMLGLSPSEIAAIQSSIDMPTLQRQVEAAAAHTYTPAERTALTKFYDSPAGQGIARKAPDFITQIMPAVQTAAMQAVAAYMAQRQINAMAGQMTGPASPNAPARVDSDQPYRPR